MIPCKTIYSTYDDKKLINPMNDFAIVKEIGKRDRYYFIDAWRHALDKNENRIDDLAKGDWCQINDWHLEVSKNGLKSIFTELQREFNW